MHTLFFRCISPNSKLSLFEFICFLHVQTSLMGMPSVCVCARCFDFMCIFQSKAPIMCLNISILRFMFYVHLLHSYRAHVALCRYLCCVYARCMCVSVFVQLWFLLFRSTLFSSAFQFLFAFVVVERIYPFVLIHAHTLSPSFFAAFFSVSVFLSLFAAQPICHRCALKIFRELWHFYVYDFCSCCLVRSAFAHHFGVWLVR